MERLDRGASLPEHMQGHWIDAEGGESELIIDGGEITCFGQKIEYDYKLVGKDGGAVVVSLQIEDQRRMDDFSRSNVTDFVLTPEGEFHAYNVKFSIEFVRRDEQDDDVA